MPTIDQYWVAMGAGGIVLALLISGVLTLGRETKKAERLADSLLASNTMLAEAAKRMADAWEADIRTKRGAR
jgi:hypothetical protein